MRCSGLRSKQCLHTVRESSRTMGTFLYYGFLVLQHLRTGNEVAARFPVMVCFRNTGNQLTMLNRLHCDCGRGCCACLACMTEKVHRLHWNFMLQWGIAGNLACETTLASRCCRSPPGCVRLIPRNSGQLVIESCCQKPERMHCAEP
jgi:hypothetical protein